MTVRRAIGTTGPLVEPATARRFGVRLRRWFRANGRDLPWRRTRDPYRILVSELMLQQTQVSRVVTRYGEFLDTFPTLHDVARARPKRVMEAWAGLGYYARARRWSDRRVRSDSGDSCDAGSARMAATFPGAGRAIPIASSSPS